MPTIESRVVEMRFDNKQFEDNAQQSMKTIDKLNKSLDFDKTSKSLDAISEAGNKFSLKGMEVAIKSVTEKFSALELVGMQAIMNIANRLTDMSVNLVKGLTVAPVSSGWDKYAQKTSAIQTIMSATAKDIENEGERMKFVNEQIEKLNWFTDETSYSLLDMTNNIGKFTSNGIKLDDAATQMQGISVWASLSGASLSDASRAMYNLSQAMSSGQVKAIDWMSIENANMATREFKETAIATAVEVGTLKKVGDEYYDSTGKAIEVTKDFRGTLAKGWFNSEVLGKTLNKFGDFTNELYEFTDATGLAASEALKMIDSYSGVNGEVFDMNTAMVETGLSADELTKYLNKLSSSEMDLGRRAFKAAQEAKTFREAIDATTEAVSSGWMQTFEYIFGDYLHAKKNWTALAEELYTLFAEPGNARNTVLKYWADEFSDEGGYGSLMRAIDHAWKGIKNIGGTFKDAFDSVFDPFYNLASEGEKYLARANWLTEFTKKIESFAKGFRSYFEDIQETAEEVTKPIEETVETVTEVVDTISKTQEMLDDLANRTIRGDFGNGQDRIDTLREMGYSYELVQNKVNELLGIDYRYEVETEKVVSSTEKVIDSNSDLNDSVSEIKEATDEIFSESYLEKRAGRLHTVLRKFNPEAETTANIFREWSVDIGDVDKTGHRLIDTASQTAPIFKEFSDLTNNTNKNLDGLKDRADTLKRIKDATATSADAFREFSYEVGSSRKELVPVGNRMDHFKVSVDSAANAFREWSDVAENTEYKSIHTGIDYMTKSTDNGAASISKLNKTANKDVPATFQRLRHLSEVTEATGRNMLKFSDNIHKTAYEIPNASERLDILRSAFIAMFEVVNWGKTIISGVFKVITHTIETVLKKLEGPFWYALTKITDFFEKIRENFDVVGSITSFFDSLLPKIDYVADTLEKFFANFANGGVIGVNHLRGSIKNLIQMIGELVSDVFGRLKLDNVDFSWADVFEKALEQLTNIIDISAEMIARGIDAIVNHKDDLKKFIDFVSGLIKDAAKFISNGVDTIMQYRTPIEEFVSWLSSNAMDGVGKLIDIFKGLQDSFTSTSGDGTESSPFDFLKKLDFSNFDLTTLQNLGKFVTDMWPKIKEFLANIDIDFNNLIKLATAGGLAAAGYVIFDFCKNVVGGFKLLLDVPKNISKVIESFRGTLSAYSNEKNSNAILNISKAIGILALSLVGLSLIDPASLTNVVSALVTVMGMVAIIMAIVAKMKGAAEENDGDSLVDKLLGPIRDFFDRAGTAFEKAANIAKIAFGLIALGVAITMFISIGKMLNKINWLSFIDGVLKMGIIGGLLVSAAVVLSKFAQNMNWQIGAGLAKMAKAIKTLAQAVVILSEIGIWDMAKGLLGIGALMAGLVAVAVTVDGVDLTSFAAGALILSIGLLALTPAIMAIGHMKLGQILKGVGAIIAVAGSMAIIGAVMTTFEGSGTELLKLSAAMLILSVPLLLVGANAEAAAKGLLLIFTSLVALMGAAYFAQFITTGLIALSAASLAISVSAVLFGAGMMAIASAIYLVAKAIPVIVDGLVYFGSAVKEHGVEISLGFLALFVGIANAIASSAVQFSMAVLTVILSICNQIVAGLPTITSYIFQIIVGILVFLGSVMGQLCEAIIQLIIALINGVANGIRNNAQPLFEAVVNIIDAILDVIIDFVASLLEFIPFVGGDLAEKLRGMKDWVVPAAQETGAAMSDAMTKSASPVGLKDSVQEGVNSELGAVDTSAGTSALESNVLGNIAGVFSGEGEISTTMQGGLTSLFDGQIPTMQDGGDLMSSEWLTSMTGGISDGETDIFDSMDSTIGSATTSASASSGKGGETVGEEWDNGVYRGVRNNLETVRSAGVLSGTTLEEGHRSATLTQSPSKIGMMLGKFWDTGIAKGVDTNLSLVRKSGERSGYSLRDSLQGVIQRIAEWVNSDMDINPVVSPVLDLSNVQNGMGMFDSMFGQRSMDLAFAGANITTRDMRLSAEMDGIKTDISDLSRSIDNLAAAQENQTYEFVTNTNLDGRNIARATARYNRSELALLDRNTNRKGGKVR